MKIDLGEICRYTSGTFNNNQLYYDINEKELLATIKGINKFEVFLLPKPFIIKTDNTQVVGFIKNNTCLNGKLFLVIIILRLYI